MQHKQWQTLFLTLSGQMPTVNYLMKTKGCQKASLFHRHHAPRNNIFSKKAAKNAIYSTWWKDKRKKVDEELPFTPALPKHVKHTWIYISFFPTQKLRNCFTNKFQYTYTPTNMLSKQKYMLTSRSKIMPKKRAYLKSPQFDLLSVHWHRLA